MDDKTFVPGMTETPLSYQQPDMRSYNAPAAPTPAPAQAPVVGFLYSISRQGIGEYWPIYLGPNTIGRSADNNVQLLEGTISDHHACLSVKRMHSTGRLIASIRDVGSKTGMYLNEEELDYDNHPCKNGDLLTIGSNYQLLVMLVEADTYGLRVADNFVPVENPSMDMGYQEDPQQNLMMDPYGPQGMTQDPMYQQPQEAPQGFNPYSSSNRRFIENATIDLNGNGNGEVGGGTQFM